ncbi:WXG100 family type VII secretion target [Corynebacterium sp. zg-331]|uniref:WXG100 family type VII secretion target n=1 Tax=unclassified Corynebacterium TaxID=2624378 RepID=UPI00128C4EF1|nr:MULTISPECIES: WXG100 family type VII secretion target [unclassified Corynebacterium]MBC3186002.1 WXG100 family type VII secretion target [Corynebacterium sp. zg-331]MPV52493.1 WXG100 family type VII secretion target [Corynebacterium sp. zg331]
MDHIKYSFGAIEAAAGDIHATSGRINALLGELKALLQPMVAAWEGESAVAYQAAQEKWDRSAEDLNQILGTIARTVSQGNDRMADVNRAAAASWG